jgi:hypothetical protein
MTMTSPNPARDEAVAVDTAAEMRHYMQTGEKVPAEVIARWRALINKCEQVSAAKPPASGVDAVVEAMENDPFWQDAPWAGTTQQDQRIRHYAEIALASLSPAATSGLAMPSREWMRDKVAADPDIEDCGAAPAATSGSEAGGGDTIAALRRDLWEAKYALAQSRENAQAWHRVCQAIATVLGLPEPEADFANVVRDWSERALAKPASSPAGGDVQEVDWSYAFDSDTLRDRFGGSFMASEPDSNGNVSVLMSQGDARAIIAALSPSTSAAEPVAQYRWRDYGTDNWSPWFEGPLPQDCEVETRTLYATPPAPAPAAVESAQVKIKPVVWEQYWGGGNDDIPSWRARTPVGLTLGVDFASERIARHSDADPVRLAEEQAKEFARYESRIRASLDLATDAEGA